MRWREQSNIASSWNSISSLVCIQDSQCVCLDSLFHCSILLSQPKESVFFTLSHLAPESTARTSIKRQASCQMEQRGMIAKNYLEVHWGFQKEMSMVVSGHLVNCYKCTWLFTQTPLSNKHPLYGAWDGAGRRTF